MFRSFLMILFLLSMLFFPSLAFASQPQNFVTLINPVRGGDFWDLKGQDPSTAVGKQLGIIMQDNLNATWLIRFDALGDTKIVSLLKSAPSSQEMGLFLEVTPSLTDVAGVKYQQSKYWHSAGSVLLAGYSVDDRKKLIDADFERFKNTFGYYPKSVGAWWIDSTSISYMKEKYGVLSSLEVADQYSTDQYQIWGQYWGTPYYPRKGNALFPAQSVSDKLGTLMFQWAARDPVNGYGNGAEESTFSVQANDYLDYHNLDVNYFSSLIDSYLNQPLNSFNQITIGLENSYDWSKYGLEYQKQLDLISQKQISGQLSETNMSEFTNWYQNNFPDISPGHIIVAKDPLGSYKQTIWFMNPYYRVGLFYNQDGFDVRDLRQYVSGQEELCLNTPCKEINFATSATRVLDDVSFNQRLVLDPGTINKILVKNQGSNYSITYQNEAQKERTIQLLPKDISVDGQTHSIDETILLAVSNYNQSVIPTISSSYHSLEESILVKSLDLVKFSFFIVLAILIPGLVLLKKNYDLSLEDVFLSICLGLVGLVIVSLVAGYLKNWWIISLYILFLLILFIRKNPYFLKQPKLNVGVLLMVILGTFFQIIPTFRSSLQFDYGVGFWGPNGHDGVWHLALVNQLLKGLPVNNPALSGEVLKNYHYLYDLLVASSHVLTQVSIADLVFRFYPILLSLLLGVGTYILTKHLFKSNLASILSLYLVYFGGSFGWVVSLLKEGKLAGESAFWANQSVSFNLNPPFAISLVFLISVIILIIHLLEENNKWLALAVVLISGTLIGFKSYAGILVLGSLLSVSLWRIVKNKDWYFFRISILALILSLLIFLPIATIQKFFIFSPFWLIHSMIDSPDRVGWERLSTAREAYLQKGNYLKFFLAETLGLIIFIGGNLGSRVIGVPALVAFGRKLNSSLIDFILVLSVMSLVIPMLFIQQGNDWNVVQFLYYLLFITAIFGGYILSLLFERGFLFKLLALAILVIAPISSLTTAQSYFGQLPVTYIPTEEVRGLKFLSGQPDGSVISPAFDRRKNSQYADPRPLLAYDTTSYVSAYSGKTSYLEDLTQNEILQTDYTKRLVSQKDFFESSTDQERNKFLRDENIKYIYIPKAFSFVANEGVLGVKKIFDNSAVAIYQVQ